VIKSLSIPVSECVDLIQRWKNEASIPSQA
jgi:hypothetical protein